MNAWGGPSSVNLLLTGHSHFDHSFDTGTWSLLTGARIIGTETTSRLARAAGVPDSQVITVRGGEDYSFGSVSVKVIPSPHSVADGMGYFDGRVARKDLAPPLRVTDFVEGGTLACAEAGLPVVRGKKAISLERQVRIAAGALVLLGAVLGAVAGAWLAARVGVWVAPVTTPVDVLLDRAMISADGRPGPPVPALLGAAPATLGSWWAVATGGLGAALAYLVPAIVLGDEDLGRAPTS